MQQIRFVKEAKPINVSHDTYRRECCYTSGVHIPYDDFVEILESMPHDTKLYFEFHNPGKQIAPGTYLNGHAGLARCIVNYYQQTKDLNVNSVIGQDFYVKIV